MFNDNPFGFPLSNLGMQQYQTNLQQGMYMQLRREAAMAVTRESAVSNTELKDELSHSQKLLLLEDVA